MTIRQHFRSTAEFAAWARPELSTPDQCYDMNKPAAIQGKQLLMTGSNEHVDRVNKLISSFDGRIEVPTYQWQNSLTGAFPNVPAYCSGEPEDMWDRAPIRSERTPVRIWVGIDTMFGLSNAYLIQRGSVIAAMALALGQVRPVYITPYSGSSTAYSRGKGENVLLTWDLQTSPMVLSEIIPNLVDPLIVRHLCIPMMYQMCPQVPSGCPFHNDEGNRDRMLEHLGGSQADIYIPSAMSESNEYTQRPVEWIQNILNQYTEEASV